MRKMLVVIMFLLATLAWAAAQQPGMGQPGSQAPGAGQMQPPTAGNPAGEPDQGGTQAAPQEPMVNAPVTEGCLGGHDPNFTLTDSSGTTYKLNIPPNADTSKLAAHLGESVNVAGAVNTGKADSQTIEVRGIGRGSGTCPASGEKAPPSPPQQ